MSRTFYDKRFGETSFSMFRPGVVHVADNRGSAESAVVPVEDLRAFLAWHDEKVLPKQGKRLPLTK